MTRRLLRGIVLGSLILVFVSAGAFAADWPQFGGPERNNISRETGLLSEWPENGPALVWTAKGLGEGYSSVSIANGIVYTMGNEGANEVLSAVDLKTGDNLWSTPTGGASRLPKGDGPRGTPTVDGALVYGLGGNGDLACLDAKTGEARWKKNILQEFAGRNIRWGISESVLIDGDRLICTPGGDKGTVVALNKEIGEMIWSAHVPGGPRAGYASAVIAEAGGVKQYVQFTAGGTVGIRASDGEFLWRNDRSTNRSANCSAAIVSDDLVFTASGYGTGGALLKLTSQGEKTEAALEYFTNDMKNHHGGMILHNGYLYGSNDPGILTCLEFKTGKVQWQERSVGKGSLTLADGHLYLRSERGPVALIEATPEAYREKGRFEQPQRSGQQSWPYPVISNGKLFLRDQDILLCYDVQAK